MTLVETRAWGRPVVVGRPDASSIGALGVELAALLGRAKDTSAAACVLRTGADAHALLALRPSDVSEVEPRGVAGAWLRSRWAAASASREARRRRRAGAASFWLEMYRELRRHIGDERLPYPLRTALREIARGCMERVAQADRDARGDRFPRRLLREPVATSLPPAVMHEVAAWASRAGIEAGRPIVALDIASGIELLRPAVDYLVDVGYQVVRIGESAGGTLYGGRVVDLTARADRPAAADVYTSLTSAFLVCAGPDAQRAAYVTNTPCLAVNAIDPFASYPVRPHGVYLMATAVDLETGATLPMPELLGERYLRNVHRYGHRSGTPAEILDAVREMHEGVSGGWRDTDAQARYRSRVVAAGDALAPRVARVATWGPDRGFIGDGRLARVQADRFA